MFSELLLFFFDDCPAGGALIRKIPSQQRWPILYVFGPLFLRNGCISFSGARKAFLDAPRSSQSVYTRHSFAIVYSIVSNDHQVSQDLVLYALPLVHCIVQSGRNQQIQLSITSVPRVDIRTIILNHSCNFNLPLLAGPSTTLPSPTPPPWQRASVHTCIQHLSVMFWLVLSILATW